MPAEPGSDDARARRPPSPIPHTGASQELGRLRALIRHSIGPLDLLDRDGRILYSSPVLERPLGYEDGNVGRNALELVHPEDLPRVADLYRELQESPCGASRRTEFRARHRDGSWRWLDTTATNLLDDPDVGAIVLSLRDVTERKTAEAELQMSQRLASIGILAAGVGHEINNPLSCVLSSLEVAERKLAAARHAGTTEHATADALARVRDGIVLARESAQRIAAIVGALRALSRPEAPEPGPVDVGRAVDAALAVAAGSFAGRVRFARAGDEVPAVLADDARLGQVLLNLLTNAAQAIAADRSDGAVQVTTGRDGSGRVAIEVRDNGSGIPPEHLPHVFDPFFTTKARDAGTGLGLSICRRIVEALGGHLTVESALGSGSAFRVVLPTAPVTASETTAPTPRIDRRRLLIVDDESNLVVALTALLDGDYEVRAATSALEAAASVRAGARYDVILCDLMMNGMDGAEFHATLTRLAPELASRIVFMTGGAFTPDARAFLDRVPNPCLSKPIDLASLQRVLRERAGA